MPKNEYSLHDNKNIEKAKVDREYLGELIIHNENLIWFTIQKYIGDPDKLAEINSMEKEDIYQIACIGFINAIDRFDCKRKVLFTTYAPTVIIGEIKGYLRDKGRLLKLPRSAYELNAKIFKYMENISYSKYAYPIEEIAASIKEDAEEVRKVLTTGNTPICMLPTRNLIDPHCGEEIQDNEGRFLLKFKKDNYEDVEDLTIEKIYQEQLLNKIKLHLNERDKRILYAKLEGKTHEQITQQENISKITVTRTMNKIRKIMKDVLDI